MRTASVLTHGYFDTYKAKTAHGLIRYGRRYKIVEVVDKKFAGTDAGRFLYDEDIGIPINAKSEEDSDVLILGISPPGGMLPTEWRGEIITAMASGKDIVSGLHTHLGHDPELSAAAEKYDVSIWDVRKTDQDLCIAKGRKSSKPVVLTVGTDSSLGKRTVALEMREAAEKADLDAAYIATGQTGIMIGCDQGMAVDAIPSDYVAGAVEDMITGVANSDLIIVEGQGSLGHLAYGTASLGILYGAQPGFLVMSHDPTRGERISMKGAKVPEVEQELGLYRSLFPSAKLAGIALTIMDRCLRNRYPEYKKKYRPEFGVPVVNVLMEPEGGKILLDHIMEEAGYGR